MVHQKRAADIWNSALGNSQNFNSSEYDYQKFMATPLGVFTFQHDPTIIHEFRPPYWYTERHRQLVRHAFCNNN